MINAHIWYKIYYLTLTVFPDLIKLLWDKYMHFLYVFTIKYRIFEQASHTEQVTYGHCD